MKAGLYASPAGDIPSRIERLPVTWFTWKVVLLAGLAWFIESLSIGSLGVALTPLKQVMSLTPSMTGLLTAASTFGVVIGLIPAGFLADKFGRKRILVLGIVEYSLFTLLCAASPNYSTLILFRFLSGLGMGAVFPLPYAIVSETVKSRHRTIFNGVMDAFLSVGYFIAPLLGLLILPRFSDGTAWRIFFAVSAAPIIYAWVIYRFLPESPRWLWRKGRAREAEALMVQIEEAVQHHFHRRLPEPEPTPPVSLQDFGKSSITSPWKPPFLKQTLSRALAASGTFFMFYIVMTYMPSLFNSKGLSFAHSLLFTAVITGAAIPGKLLNGFLAERFGRKSMYIAFMGLAAISALFFGIATAPTTMVIYACVMSLFGTGAFPALKMSYAEQYPTYMRTTGAATVETIGRFIGGVVGSYVMPVILNNAGIAVGFYIVSAVALLAVTAELVWSPETKNSTLEQLELRSLRQGVRHTSAS